MSHELYDSSVEATRLLTELGAHRIALGPPRANGRPANLRPSARVVVEVEVASSNRVCADGAMFRPGVGRHEMYVDGLSALATKTRTAADVEAYAQAEKICERLTQEWLEDRSVPSRMRDYQRQPADQRAKWLATHSNVRPVHCLGMVKGGGTRASMPPIKRAEIISPETGARIGVHDFLALDATERKAWTLPPFNLPEHAGDRANQALADTIARAFAAMQESAKGRSK